MIAGARPNFMKIAPIIESIHESIEEGVNIRYRLVHTGQHYDKNMSDSFFEELGIPEPDENLECGGGTQAEQAANIMVRFEKDLMANPADIVMVVGDVTSTLACSIVAKKLCTDVAHVEAGIRSGDLTMPEEINRMVTDAITDQFFTTSTVANDNLKKAGIDENRIHFVGNTMIDTLMKNIGRFKQPEIWNILSLRPQEYFVTTLHRPSNVDGQDKLRSIIGELIEHSRGLPVIFPVHPRTAKILSGLGIEGSNLHMIDPLGYLEFNYLVKHAKAVITDSGGVTEETTIMKVPCLTLRNSTERPETISVGTNELIGIDPANIKPAFEKLFSGNWKKGSVPELWDGRTSGRIVKILTSLYR